MRSAIAIGCLTTAVAVGFSVSASALTWIIDSQTGPATPNVAVQWISTSNSALGTQWLAGINATPPPGSSDQIALPFAPYPSPDPIPDILVPGTSAELMWHCGRTGSECQDDFGTITGGDGPLETFYKFVFPIGGAVPPDVPNVFRLKASILADDYFELWANGAFIIAIDPDNFLEPEEIDITVPLKRGQDQILAIRAMDGTAVADLAPGTCTGSVGIVTPSQLDTGPWCLQNRSYEWLFIDGIVNIAEPPSLAVLAVGGLLAFALASGLVPDRSRRG